MVTMLVRRNDAVFINSKEDRDAVAFDHFPVRRMFRFLSATDSTGVGEHSCENAHPSRIEIASMILQPTRLRSNIEHVHRAMRR